MKKTMFILGLTGLIYGCQMDRPDVSVELGEARYTANAMPLTPKVNRALTNTAFSDLFDMDISVYDPTGVWPVENIYLYKIPKKEGRFVLNNTSNQVNDGKIGAAYYTLSDQGDVLEEVYIVDETASDNYIDVLYYKSKTSEVAGKINATFFIDPDRGKINPASPDTLRITEGEFYLKIQ